MARCGAWIAARFVFIDESAATAKMIRLYGRALRGLRARDAAPHGHWGVRTIIGALFGDGRTACMSIAAAIDAEVFHRYVVCFLVPKLCPDDIVILDNLCAHKQQGTIAAIGAAGVRVESLLFVGTQPHREDVEQGQAHPAETGSPNLRCPR